VNALEKKPDRKHHRSFALPYLANTDKMAEYQEFQQWVVPVDPYYRLTVPINEANYGQRLQCFLMDFLQTPLDHDPASPPRGWFLSSTLPETLLFHKKFNNGNDYINPYGIQFLQGLGDVEVSVYVFKDKDPQVGGRMHYRIEALAVCFDQHGRRIMEPSGDSCMGFLAIQVRIVFLLIFCFLPRRSCFGASILTYSLAAALLPNSQLISENSN
jgi:hypothetical protein